MSVGDLVVIATAPRETVGLIVELYGGGAWVLDGKDGPLHHRGVIWYSPSDIKTIGVL